ncbi:transporter substrate-binding domain-containing protein [Photobacterium japonica]
MTVFLLLGGIFWVVSAQEEPRQTVTFAVEGSYPPFSWTEPNGRIMGFDVDIARALCREMKVRCRIVAREWPALIPDLLAHRYDAVIAAMSMTDVRRKQVTFTDKYAQIPSRYVAHRDTVLTFTSAGLTGVKLGVIRDTSQDHYLTAQFGDVARIVRSDTIEGLHADLFTGRVAAVLADAAVLDSAVLNTPGGGAYAFVGPVLRDPAWIGDGFGIALRPQDGPLQQRLNAAITAIRAKGIYQMLAEPYFSYDVYGY